MISNKELLGIGCAVVALLGGAMAFTLWAIPQTDPPPFASRPMPAVTPASSYVMQPYPSNEFCSGSERLCATAITTSPGETVRKLVESLPEEAAGRRYSVRLSVVFADEENLLPFDPPHIPRKETPP